MSKKFIIILFGVLLVCGGIGYVMYRNQNRSLGITNIDSRGTTIIAFGDSITKGFGIGEENAYPVIVSREIGFPIRNAGLEGDGSASAFSRLEEDVFTHDPWIVIVFLGGNDFLKRTPGSVVRENLSKIIVAIQERGAIVVLVGIETVVIESYSKIYKDLSEQHHTAYVPDVLRGIIGHNELMVDTVHPNEKGHEIIAERILKVLKPLIEETKTYRN